MTTLIEDIKKVLAETDEIHRQAEELYLSLGKIFSGHKATPIFLALMKSIAFIIPWGCTNKDDAHEKVDILAKFLHRRMDQTPDDVFIKGDPNEQQTTKRN
jgi:hypothetical protein